MKVCIAEKPSVAKEIADVLGAKTRRDGYYEGNGYQVTWTFGHLCTLKEPGDYTPQWKSWNFSQLPMIPPRFGIKLIEDKGVEKQFKIIESLFQKADAIVNCGDAGQEGELIQRWVMQKAGVTCPVQRLWISSLTEESIREGFGKLQDQSAFQPLYEAGLCRAIGDWLLGMNATRLYTLKYTTRGSSHKVLSIGRVQTPTLALVVKRQLEIDNFKPEQYWELKTSYRDTVFSATKGKFSDKAEGERLLESIKASDFVVTDVSKKEGKEFPLRLYDLTSLQVDCNRKYGFSAEDTLKHIQSLYEKKMTTYPRVDTTFLSDDIYPKCPDILSKLTPYQNFTAPLLQLPKLPKTKRVFDNSKVTDHHAIIPTGVYPSNLSYEEKRVYDLVARRFISVFYPECIFSTTTVLGKAAEVEFKVTGKEILKPGWRVLYDKPRPKTDAAQQQPEGQDGQSQQDADPEKADEKILPAFTVGESGPHKPDLAEKWTQPPKPYTEATLLRAMETAGKLVENEELRDALKENGIGRPSTRAAIIETLYKRGYMRKEKKNIIATRMAIELMNLIHVELIKSAELTGIWEKRLRDVERRQYDSRQFLDELKQMVSDLVREVLADNSAQKLQ